MKNNWLFEQTAMGNLGTPFWVSSQKPKVKVYRVRWHECAEAIVVATDPESAIDKAVDAPNVRFDGRCNYEVEEVVGE